MATKKEILEFGQQHDLCVLSTVSPANTPESAVIKCAISEKFEIIFNTYNTYRKYKNMEQNDFNLFNSIVMKNILYDGFLHD